MITGYIHTISGKRYSLREIQFGIGQFYDGNGSIMCCPMNGGLMRPAAEPDHKPAPAVELRREFGRVKYKKFNAMMFMEMKNAAVS